jgi:hypothetical protein
MKYLPHALVACVALLLIAYAVGGLTAAMLFRGILAAFASFVLFAVISLMTARPPMKRAYVPPPLSPVLYGTATAAISAGDVVAIEVATMHVKPVAAGQYPKDAVQ